MITQNGRPTDSRQPKELRVYDLLDKLQIDYLRVDHEPAMTMELCLAVDEALGAAMCKNLFLCNRQQTDFYLLLMPGDKSFKTKDLSAQIGSSRLSFAGAEHMEQYLDITPGSVSVMGLMNDKENKVRLLIDRDLLNAEYIGVHPCVNTSSLKIRTEDMMQVIIPAMEHSAEIVNL